MKYTDLSNLLEENGLHDAPTSKDNMSYTSNFQFNGWRTATNSVIAGVGLLALGLLGKSMYNINQRGPLPPQYIVVSEKNDSLKQNKQNTIYLDSADIANILKPYKK
jgi:hypothetical protein